jgi:hypothetical protein
VRVVDDHAEALTGLDRLEAARRGAGRRHGVLDRPQRDFEQQGERHRAEHVVDVEAPAQARLERERALRRAHEQLRAVGAQLIGLAADVGRGRLDAEAQLGIQATDAGVVGIDGARAAAVEERGLDGDVLLEVAVEIEVVLREVREGDRGELGRHEPPLRDCDRRRFHRTGQVARLDHGTQRTLQIGRLRRRQARSLAAPADAPLHGAEQAAGALRGVQHRREQDRRGRLAVRARDADDLELAARLPVQRRGELRHTGACVVRHHLRHAEIRQLTLDEQRDRAVGDGGGREVVTVRIASGQAAEQRSGPAALRAVGDIDDVDACRRADHTRGDACLPAQRGELHGGGSLMAEVPTTRPSSGQVRAARADRA